MVYVVNHNSGNEHTSQFQIQESIENRMFSVETLKKERRKTVSEQCEFEYWKTVKTQSNPLAFSNYKNSDAKKSSDKINHFLIPKLLHD